MGSLVLHPTDTAQWHALISEAERACDIRLNEELESYLVFLLVRFSRQPELATSVLAMEFLNSLHAIGRQRQEALRDVGDKCLLFSGLFPGRAQRRHVQVSYFVDLGQSAYGAVSDLVKQQLAILFSALCQSFVPLMEVLQTTREISGKMISLLPLEALELWQQTGSQHALAVLQHYSDATLIKSHPSIKLGKLH